MIQIVPESIKNHQNQSMKRATSLSINLDHRRNTKNMTEKKHHPPKIHPLMIQTPIVLLPQIIR